jgi:hypothetical protein
MDIRRPTMALSLFDTAVLTSRRISNGIRIRVAY